MTTSVPFLNTPYGGYLHSQVPSEDEELTHVGPGTLAGEWFRRFWQPIAVSEDLKDLPVAIRILGEDLVLFRDRSGQIGLLELHCSHRGTSLEFGQIEERGIRCCYHAWLYDVDGKLLETPGEPAESTLKDRLYHGAYPTHEHGGLVFAYMGPAENRPAFPILDTFNRPGYRSMGRGHDIWPCNWLQVRDNLADPVHLRFLHTVPGNIGFGEDYEHDVEMDFMETPLGLVSIDTRRVGGLAWVRMRDYILPNIYQICEVGEGVVDEDLIWPTVIVWTVPVDDIHSQRFDFVLVPEGEERSRKVAFGQGEDRSYEDRQRVPGDYDAQASQRPIAVHALEHLASTDRGVIMSRNMVREGIQAVRNGGDPKGVTQREGEIIPTYTLDRILRVAPAPTIEEDRLLLRKTGRRVAEERIEEFAGVGSAG